MVIKMTKGNMIDVFKSMDKFAECTGKLAYALSRTRRQMVKHIEAFEQTRADLVMKYGSADEDGNFNIKPGTEEYTNFINELINISQEIAEIDVYQISKKEFEEGNYYSKDANVRDYEIIETVFVKPEEENNTEKDNDSDGDE